MSDSDSDSSSFDEDSSTDSTGEEEGENSQAGGEKKEDEGDEEDPVVKAIKEAKEKKVSNRPPDISLEDTPCNICFHPSEDLIAVAQYNAGLDLYKYSNEGNEKLKTVEHGEYNARDLKFNAEGDKLYVLLNDKSFVIHHTDGMKVERKIPDVSEETGTCLHVVDENVIAIGDEDGYVNGWDRRMNGIAFSLKAAEDSISAMVSDEEGKVLVCSSTEGTLSTIKVRAKKIQTQSEPYETDFNCMGVLKQNTKLAVGDCDGKVYLFNWGEFGYHSDVYPGHSEAINAMIPITERIILTGTDDGYIRAVNFFPMKFLGVVGKHKYPVEGMDVCNDGHLIASICGDQVVRFWNVSYFEDVHIPAVLKTSSKATKAKDMKHNLPSSRQQNASDFFQGLKE